MKDHKFGVGCLWLMASDSDLFTFVLLGFSFSICMAIREMDLVFLSFWSGGN